MSIHNSNYENDPYVSSLSSSSKPNEAEEAKSYFSPHEEVESRANSLASKRFQVEEESVNPKNINTKSESAHKEFRKVTTWWRQEGSIPYSILSSLFSVLNTEDKTIYYEVAGLNKEIESQFDSIHKSLKEIATIHNKDIKKGSTDPNRLASEKNLLDGIKSSLQKVEETMSRFKEPSTLQRDLEAVIGRHPKINDLNKLTLFENALDRFKKVADRATVKFEIKELNHAIEGQLKKFDQTFLALNKAAPTAFEAKKEALSQMTKALNEIKSSVGRFNERSDVVSAAPSFRKNDQEKKLLTKYLETEELIPRLETEISFQKSLELVEDQLNAFGETKDVKYLNRAFEAEKTFSEKIFKMNYDDSGVGSEVDRKKFLDLKYDDSNDEWKAPSAKDLSWALKTFEPETFIRYEAIEKVLNENSQPMVKTLTKKIETVNKLSNQLIDDFRAIKKNEDSLKNPSIFKAFLPKDDRLRRFESRVEQARMKSAHLSSIEFSEDELGFAQHFAPKNKKNESLSKLVEDSNLKKKEVVENFKALEQEVVSKNPAIKFETYHCEQKLKEIAETFIEKLNSRESLDLENQPELKKALLGIVNFANEKYSNLPFTEVLPPDEGGFIQKLQRVGFHREVTDQFDAALQRIFSFGKLVDYGVITDLISKEEL